MRTILLSALLALPAAAQTPCTGLPDALAALAARYDEAPRVGFGVNARVLCGREMKRP